MTTSFDLLIRTDVTSSRPTSPLPDRRHLFQTDVTTPDLGLSFIPAPRRIVLRATASAASRVRGLMHGRI